MSDNTTNFQGANQELKEMHELLLSEKHNAEVEKFLSKQGFLGVLYRLALLILKDFVKQRLSLLSIICFEYTANA